MGTTEVQPGGRNTLLSSIWSDQNASHSTTTVSNNFRMAPSLLNPETPCWIPNAAGEAVSIPSTLTKLSRLTAAKHGHKPSNSFDMAVIEDAYKPFTTPILEGSALFPAYGVSFEQIMSTASESSGSKKSTSIGSDGFSHTGDIFTPTSRMNGQGLPVSTSLQSMRQLEMTPQKDSSLLPMSTTQLYTEPRNYAPTTVGRAAAFGPPPKFDLSALTAGSSTSSAAEAAFVANLTSLGLQRHAEAKSSQQSQAQTAMVPVSKCPQVSYQLLALTNTPTGLPDLQSALYEENFPFVESARQSFGKNNGVIQLSNVSFASLWLHSF